MTDRSPIEPDDLEQRALDTLAALYPDANDAAVGAAAAAVARLVEDAFAYAARRLGAERLSVPAQDALVEALFAPRLDAARLAPFVDERLPARHPAAAVQRLQFELESALGAPVEAWAGAPLAPEEWERFYDFLALVEGGRDPHVEGRLARLAALGDEGLSPVPDDEETA